MKIIIASHNQGKIKELSALLAPKGIELIAQASLAVSDIPETGLTFVENALLKARHASKATNLPALADDSGLIVPYLNGAPGLKTARFAGEKASSQDNIAKLLSMLRAAQEHERQAYFYCLIVYMRHWQDPAPIIAEGKWHGYIAKEPQGQEGFGYDPIFYLPEKQQTSAELPFEIKNKISHRGQAIQSFINQITKTL